MLAFGICPLCKEDVYEFEDGVPIARKAAMSLHMHKHAKKSMQRIIAVAHGLRQAHNLPSELIEPMDELVRAELLLSEIPKVFYVREWRVYVSVHRQQGVMDTVHRMDCDSRCSWRINSNDGFVTIKTWMTPEELTGLKGVEKVEEVKDDKDSEDHDQRQGSGVSLL